MNDLTAHLWPVLLAIACFVVALTADGSIRWADWMLFGAACLSVPVVLFANRRAGGRVRPRWVFVPLGIAVLTSVGFRSAQDLAGLERPLPQRIDTVAELGSDPQRRDHGATAELVAGGRRWFADFDRSNESVVAALRTGDRLRVEGRVGSLDGAPPGWVRSRHLAGRLRVESAEAVGDTRPWFRIANGFHSLLVDGAASMSEQHRALYTGLVVGDDRGQDDLTQFRFRAAGLTHLLAVSGQNMVFVLVVLSPLLSRIGFRWRWLLGVAAIGGFVVITRAEPSVLRAAVMAVLALTTLSLGRVAAGPRLLAIAVSVLLVADPLLAHSVGFRLSVAATAGLVVLARPLGRAMSGPPWLTAPLSVTLAAQMGAVPVMVATFGPVSVLSVPANLAAEPAAALVMTSGLTVGIGAGLLREELAEVLQIPARVGVWWVDLVAEVAAGLSVPPVGLVGWAALLCACAGASVLAAGTGEWGEGRSPPWSGSVRRPGSALCLVALLGVLVLRPPSAIDGERRDLEGPAQLHACGGVWVVFVGTAVDRRVSALVAESLWAQGLGRVAVLVAAAPGREAEALAAGLAARLLPVDDLPGGVGCFRPP